MAQMDVAAMQVYRFKEDVNKATLKLEEKARTYQTRKLQGMVSGI